LLLFARWYRMWILAGVAVLAVAAATLVRGRPVRRLVENRGVNVVAAVTFYLSAWQFLIMGPWKLQLGVGYFPSFAILAAICLGYWMAVVADDLASTRGLRTAALLGLCAFFLVAPAQSRPPMLPLSVSWRDPPVTVLYGLAAELGRVVPPGSRVFHLGGPLGLYVAGLEPYLRQERDLYTLLPASDGTSLRGIGFWGQADIRDWLARDADYAVIVPTRVALYRAGLLAADIHLIELLLTKHFTRVAVLDLYPGLVYDVYRRTR
jgi:hypothetical protein